MTNFFKKITLLFGIFLLIILFTLSTNAQGGGLVVTFIDVGEGDSCLIQTPTGKNIIIDGGRSSQGKKILALLKEKGIGEIDTIVATHPDLDHIGGLLVILDSDIMIDKVLDPGYQHATPTYQDFLSKIARRQEIKYYQPRAGQILDWGWGLGVQVLSPSHLFPNGNDSSIVIKLTYGSTSFLFTGDAGYLAEDEMVAHFGRELQSTILRVGHHGSKTSTSSLFLNYVNPEVAIISVGPNHYRHPSSATLNRLNEIGVKTYRTDEKGNITVIASGSTYWIKTEK